jgi:alpha-ribazole phosphatase
MTENLLLIRHFDTQAPRKGAFYGSSDYEITSDAAGYFEELKKKFESHAPKEIYCSPLQRCRQTAEKYFPQSKMQILDEAREVNFGDWEGMTFEQIVAQFPEQVEDWQNNPAFAFPGGEALEQFKVRMNLLKEMLSNTQNKTTVLVAHGGVIRYLLCLYLGLETNQSLAFQVDTGSVTHIKLFENGSGVLAGLNNKGNFSWPE